MVYPSTFFVRKRFCTKNFDKIRSYDGTRYLVSIQYYDRSGTREAVPQQPVLVQFMQVLHIKGTLASETMLVMLVKIVKTQCCELSSGSGFRVLMIYINCQFYS
jgi:hypothetical protein